MLRFLVSSIWTGMNTLLNRGDNPLNNQPSTSTWQAFRNFIFSIVSSSVQSAAESDALYEYVNTFLGYSTTNRNNTDHHQRRNSGVSRLSRPNFRRRSNHNGGVIRLIRPTINIHIH